MIDAILAPIDFSAGSMQSADYAARMAEQFEATLWLVHVGSVVGDHDASIPSVRAEVYHKARAEQARVAHKKMDSRIAELRDRHPGLTVKTRFLSGTPHAAIIEAAHQLEVDLIVMGTSGLTGLSHFLIGSTAERVVRTSKIPVLTVRGER